MAEGVIFGGYFLNEEEFKIIFKEWLNIYFDDFLKELTGPNGIITINGNLKKISKKEIFERWERIEIKYFKNPKVQLIAAVKLQGEDSNVYTWTRTIDESEALRKGSLSLNTERVKKALLNASDLEAALILNQLMNNHFQRLMSTLSEKPTDNDIEHLSKYYMNINNNSFMKLLDRINIKNKKRYSGYIRKILKNEVNYKWHPFSNKSISQILYGSKIENGIAKGGMLGVEGKIHDSYMNHIGAKHNEILSYFKDISKYDSQQIENYFNSHKGFRAEEGENFIPRLTEGLNNTSWIAGGDIVVYNKNRQVIHNIQLKTTKYITQSYHIATSDLKESLNNFISFKENKNVDKIADLMFKALKNDASNFSDDFEEKAIDEQVLSLVRESLNLTK